ncbi:MAG: agglutinin biogenesis protein MshI [Betaproteobacteria bacterium]|nr:agglutinin biogenesis protein MshI [Betaproteobacteria bacterium]
MAWFSKKKAQPGWMAVSTDTDAIRLAHVERPARGKPKVDHWGIVKLDDKDGAELQQAADEYRLGRYRCATLLHPAEYQLLMVDAPNVPREELKAAIRWRVKDLLEYHIDDATMDVLDIPVDKDAAGKSHYMYAVAAKNEIVQGQIAQFERANIPLQVIDIPETAQRNIAQLYETADRGIGMLSFDYSGGLFTLSFAGELYLARRLEMTWPQLAGAQDSQRQAYFERIVVELQRSLDHFERQYRNITLSELLLGPMPEDIGLQAFLSSQLYLPLRQINLADALEFVGSDMGVDKQWQLLHVLGAALRAEPKAL